MKTITKRLLCCFLSFLILINAVPLTAVTANAQTSVSYLDENGTTQQCVKYTAITDQTELSTGWYVVNSDVTISDRITVSGNVHLILADGKTLTAGGGINVSSNNAFTVYAQSVGNAMGKLTANAFVGSGIGGNDLQSCGKVTINGGNVTATGSYWYAGIGGGTRGDGGEITITGGIVTATGGNNGAGIGGGSEGAGGKITIKGGIV